MYYRQISTENTTEDGSEQMELAKAWILGNELACYAVQNAVIDAFVEKINIRVLSSSSDVVTYTYEHTVPVPDDPLHWMMVQDWVNDFI